MTKHGGTFKLSGETRELLRNNRDFFEQVSALNGSEDPGKIPLNILGKDPEAVTEAKIQANGDVEVTFVYPIDEATPDGKSTSDDGRIYLRDTFLFDPSEQHLKSFTRNAEYNGKGQGNWQAWLDKYKAAFAAAPLTADSEAVKKFARTVARTFTRPITDETGTATLPEIREVWVKDSSYITAANVLILKQHEDNPQSPELKLKVKDKLNGFAIIQKDDALELVFTFAVDNDDDPANGRILLKDKFVLDPATRAFKELKRSWELAPEAADNAEFKAVVDRLQATEAPTRELAEAFVSAMAPVVLGAPQGDALAALSKPVNLPKDYRSPLAKRLAAKNAPLSETPAGAVEALDAMHAVALDTLAQRHDASLGWYNRTVKGQGPVDFIGGEALLKAVFEKAAQQVKAAPAGSAFAGLRALKLEGAEAALRDRLLADPRMAQIDSIGAESDAALRAEEFLRFAREDLLKQAELGGAALQIAKRLSGIDAVKAEAEKILALGEGKGAFGTKMEYLVPRFAKQVADPKMLAAMGAAPFLGWGFEFGTLRWLGVGGKVSGFGRTVAGLAGLGGEAFAFTAMHRGLESAVHDPAKFGVGFWKEVGGASLLFGFMRGGHAISGRFTRSLAEGKWGGLFGGRTAAEGVEFMVNPTGRILVDQTATKALTRWGNLASGLATHGGGIFAMYAAGAVSRRLGWQPDNKQSLGEHWFEAALSYGQASAGFSLANRLTGGRLQASLAELKILTTSLGDGLPDLKAESAKRNRPITLKPKTGATKFDLKAGDQAWSVQLPNIQRLWIGRGLSRQEGVTYGANEATLNVGDKYGDVNQYHAILIRDQAGIFWYLADTGSTYGTYVNSKKLNPGEYTLLKDSVSVQLGDDFQLRIEPDGVLLAPDPRVTTVVQVPMPRGQRRLDPPKAADQFPFEALFPDKNLPADANIEVGELKSMRGTTLPLRSGKPVWNLSLASGAPPIARVYVDAKGRWVLQKLDGNAKVELARVREGAEKRWTLEKLVKETDSQPGLGRQDWMFIEPGDQLFLQNQIFDFIVHPEPVSLQNSGEGSLVLPGPAVMEVSIDKAGQALDPDRPSDEMPTAIRRRKGDMVFPNPVGTPVQAPPPYREAMPTPIAGADLGNESELPIEDRPTAEYGYRPLGDLGSSDAEHTRPGIPVPIDIPNQFPHLLLEKIPEGEPPFVLVSGVRGLEADRRHTRYLLGSAPEVTDNFQLGVQIEGHRIEANHAELFLGRKAGGEDYQWFLQPHRHSEQGVFVDGYRKLKPDERVPLTPGRVFALGDMKGERGGIQFSFEMPWLQKPADIQNARPAAKFPEALLENLDSDMPPMALRSNMGSYFLRADRKNTRYVFGSGSNKMVTPLTTYVELQGSDKVAPEHCEIFVDQRGQWYLRSFSEEYPTYLRNKRIEPGVIYRLASSDAIELGGDPKNGIGIAMLFHKPEYLSSAHAEGGGEKPVPAGVFGAADRGDAAASPSEPVLELGADLVKTVVPPLTPPPPRRNSPVIPPPADPDRPGSKLPRITPPPVPQVTRPASETDAPDIHELKTGVYSVDNNLAGLLADSALGGEVEHLPGQDSPTLKPRPAQPPPAAPKSPPPAPDPAPAVEEDPMADWGREFEAEASASPAAASVRPEPAPQDVPPPAAPEESFAGIAEAVLAQAEPDPLPAAPDAIETVRAEPPRVVPTADLSVPAPVAGNAEGDDFPTVQATPPRQVSVPRPDPGAAAPKGGKKLTFASLTPEQLGKIHPELKTPAILPWLQPLLQTDRAHLRQALEGLKAFPQLTANRNKLLAGSAENPLQLRDFITKLTGFGVGLQAGAEPFARMSEDMKFQLFELSREGSAEMVKRGYRLESDEQYLRVSSFPVSGEAKADTMLAITVAPGMEASLTEAVFHHFLYHSEVPIETVLPLSTEGREQSYLGVFFRSEDAAAVLEAARALAQNNPGLLTPRLIQFSHQLVDSGGERIPGMGVMEFNSDKTHSNPLQAKSYAVAGAFNVATKEANAHNQGIVDKGVLRREILKFFDKLKFDLNNPGFNQGSVSGSHREVAARSVAMPPSTKP